MKITLQTVIITILSIFSLVTAGTIAYFGVQAKVNQIRQEANIWGQNQLLAYMSGLQDKCEKFKLTVQVDDKGATKDIEFNPVCKK